MAESINYEPIAKILLQGSVPLRDAASTLHAYAKGPSKLAVYLIRWRVDNRFLSNYDQKLLVEAIENLS